MVGRLQADAPLEVGLPVDLQRSAVTPGFRHKGLRLSGPRPKELLGSLPAGYRNRGARFTQTPTQNMSDIIVMDTGLGVILEIPVWKYIHGVSLSLPPSLTLSLSHPISLLPNQVHSLVCKRYVALCKNNITNQGALCTNIWNIKPCARLSKSAVRSLACSPAPASTAFETNRGRPERRHLESESTSRGFNLRTPASCYVHRIRINCQEICTVQRRSLMQVSFGTPCGWESQHVQTRTCPSEDSWGHGLATPRLQGKLRMLLPG